MEAMHVKSGDFFNIEKIQNATEYDNLIKKLNRKGFTLAEHKPVTFKYLVLSNDYKINYSLIQGITQISIGDFMMAGSYTDATDIFKQ